MNLPILRIGFCLSLYEDGVHSCDQEMVKLVILREEGDEVPFYIGGHFIFLHVLPSHSVKFIEAICN